MDGVGGGAFADLVAAAPQAQAVGVGEVGADAADEDDVLVAGVQGHGVALIGQVVHQAAAGGVGDGFPGLGHGDGLIKMQAGGDGVAAHHRHPDAGAAHQQLRQVHNLPALVLQLHFLAGIALVLLAANLGNQVEGNLVGEHLGLVLLPSGQCLHLVHQLDGAAGTGTGHRLIGGDGHGADGADGVQGIDGGGGDDGGAVGVGDDALVLLHVLGVDFRHHQGHIVIQPEGGGIVHEDSTGLHNGGGEALGDVVFRSAQHNVHALESVVRRLPDGDGLAPEGYRLSRRPGRGQRHQLPHREVPLCQNLHHFLPHCARCAQDCYRVLFHFYHSYFLITLLAGYTVKCKTF